VAENRGRVRIEDGLKRVRVFLHGELIADSTNVKLVWEKPWYPTYYFPPGDVHTDQLVATGETKRSPSRGDAELFDVKTPHGVAEKAALHFAGSPIEGIDGYFAFDWDAMGEWFEEDEQVFVHARDPFTRIDILQSSRRIEVFVGGAKVADSVRPRILFETGLPARYYLPKTDVRMDLLEATDLNTACPYKGTASYYSVTTGEGTAENVVWWYPAPVKESADIAGMVSFYNEKVEIKVDGELESKPKTVFS
jgi:uncharacterized protein (DUF427 family)